MKNNETINQRFVASEILAHELRSLIYSESDRTEVREEISEIIDRNVSRLVQEVRDRIEEQLTSPTDVMTPPQLAKLWGVEVVKIHNWIRKGQLDAINVAVNPTGRPRYRIEMAAIDRFKQERSAKPEPKRVSQRRRSLPGVTEYF